MPASGDFYAILGVSRDADTATLKKAYRTQAKRWHPDVNDSQEAEERFKEVARAWDVLSDPSRRRDYDRTGNSGRRREVDAATAQFLRDFREAVSWIEDLFFDEILPRYVERYFRGRGVFFLERLLHDVEGHVLMEILTDPEPSPPSRERARRARVITPVVVRAVAFEDGSRRPILGRSVTHYGVMGAAWGWSGQVELYAGSYLLSGITEPSRLAAHILPVLAREYVRLVEDLLPPELRPVHTRDAVLAGERAHRLSPARARLADQWFVIKPWAGIAAVVLVILMLLAIILPGFAG
jgi:hypothetical protein